MKKILALLLVLPLLLLTACSSGEKKIYTDYNKAYISYGNQLLYLKNIEGYYFKYEGIIVVISENGIEYMTSIENVMLVGDNNNELKPISKKHLEDIKVIAVEKKLNKK